MNRSRLATVLTATAILFGLSTLSPAQAAATTGTGPAATQPAKRLKAALAQLNLSSTQTAQIKQILAAAKTQLQSAKTSGQTVSRKAVMHQTIKQILGVLTKPQKVKFMQIMKSYRTKGTGTA